MQNNLITAELYVCKNCQSVELELNGSCECGGQFECTDFVPAARLSALQTEVEGRGETIRRLLEALCGLVYVVEKDVKRNGGNGAILLKLDKAHLAIENTALAATAPVEGGKNE